MRIGEKIKKMREERNLQQREFAGDLRVSAQLICSIETGQRIPSLMVAMDIAKYFGISVEELCGEE